MDIGKQGEMLFAQIMTQRGYKVVDTTDIASYQKYDIDFILTSSATGLTRSFEVKYDTRINRTNNLYLELTNIHSKQWGGQGWWLHCNADYLAYGDYHTKKFYVFELKELKEKVAQLPQKIAYCGNESSGLLVSLEQLEGLYVEL